MASAFIELDPPRKEGLERAPVLIHGDTDMARLIRAYPWSQTSVGPIEGWPESLRGAVNVMLSCGFPASIWWGGDGLQFYNDGYRPLMSNKHPTGLGQDAKECWKEAWPLIAEQTRAVMEQGKALLYENRLVPIERDGVLHDVYWTYSYSPIYGAAGRPEGVMVICRDVTDAVLAGRRLEESREELRQVLDATNDAVVSIDRDWRMTYFNPKAQEMFDPRGEQVNKVVWEAFPETAAEGSLYAPHYYDAMERGIASRFEAHYAEPLNMYLQLEVYPTRSGIAVFARDISELKRATTALLQNEKLAAVGRLAASIAHEINNPLESVTNLLYLARSSGNEAEVQGYLDVAERELRRVSIISNQTLRFYRQASAPVSVSCEELFDSVLSIYQGRLVNSGIWVEKRKRAFSPVTCFDGEIRQVLSNLVGNAIDAIGSGGGRLLVRSRNARDWKTGREGVALTVADTGKGMSQEVLGKVFEAFYTTKGIGGTGLGLWVSKEIVDRHEGMLKVRSSQAEGQHGTVFALFLPFEAASRTEDAGAGRP